MEVPSSQANEQKNAWIIFIYKAKLFHDFEPTYYIAE